MRIKMICALVSLLMGVCAEAEVRMGGHDGNGGGGIHQDGRDMTFGSAGFAVIDDEQAPIEVPQLDETLDAIQSSKYLNPKFKKRFLDALIPAANRRYYRVDADYFTPETRAKVLAEYHKVIPFQGLKVFALTKGGSTFLLPEFYQLKPIEQKAILFHEAFWIVNGTWARYEDTIASEIAFQKYLEDQKSMTSERAWLYTMFDFAGIASISIDMDLQSGALGTLLKEERYISVRNLLGSDYVNCESSGAADCMVYLKLHLRLLAKHYPESKFISFFSNRVSNFAVPEIAFYTSFYKKQGGGGGWSGMACTFNCKSPLFKAGFLDLKTELAETDRNFLSGSVAYGKFFEIVDFSQEHSEKMFINF